MFRSCWGANRRSEARRIMEKELSPKDLATAWKDTAYLVSVSTRTKLEAKRSQFQRGSPSPPGLSSPTWNFFSVLNTSHLSCWSHLLQLAINCRDPCWSFTLLKPDLRTKITFSSGFQQGREQEVRKYLGRRGSCSCAICSRSHQQTHTKAFLLELPCSNFRHVRGLTNLNIPPNSQMSVPTPDPRDFLLNATSSEKRRGGEKKKSRIGFIFGFMFEYIHTTLIWLLTRNPPLQQLFLY